MRHYARAEVGLVSPDNGATVCDEGVLMARSCKLICAFALAVGLVTASAGAALASTLYVNGKTGNDTNPCTEPAAPCKTIDAAVIKSKAMEGTATIETANRPVRRRHQARKARRRRHRDRRRRQWRRRDRNRRGERKTRRSRSACPAARRPYRRPQFVVTPSGDEGAGIDAGGTIDARIDVIVHMRDAEWRERPSKLKKTAPSR